MVDISLDLNPASQTYNDFLIINGDLALTSDAQQGGANPVLQDILQALRTFLNEWYLDNTIGVPWFQQILVKNPDQETIDGLIRATILDRPGVLQLTSYNSTLNLAARTLTVNFTAQTTSGVVDYSGTLVAGNGS
jgi:hypothetical protein